MNATPPLAQAPSNPNPVQAAAPAAPGQTDRSNTQDFAGAMSVAGGKQTRKSAAKQHDTASGGSALPVAGNQPPPNAAPTAGAPPTGQAGTTAVSNNPPTAGAPPMDPANAAPAPGQRGATPPDPAAAAEELAAANSASAAAKLNYLPTTPGGPIADAGPVMPHAASIQAPPIAAASHGVAPAAATSVATTQTSAAAAPAPKITDATASKADAAAATSEPTSANTDVTQNAQAQASTPSAAIAQGTSAPAPDSASFDELATPDTGVTLQGVAAATSEVAPLPAGVTAHTAAPTSASVTAATAASIVQGVSASADSGPSDKHSRDNSPDGSAGAQQLLTSNAASDAAPGPTPTFKVSAGVDTADFGQGVAERVSLMMAGNLTSAKLQVNPPSLGPIEVRIALQGGHAQVWMSSHSAVTRDALESSSPKLREMLGSQGFAQVSVDISQRSFQERTPQPQAYESVSAVGSGSAAPVQSSSAATARSASGLLDAYA